MDKLARIIERARGGSKNICLPETHDDRVLKAAAILIKDNITDVTLIGSPDKIAEDATRLDLDLSSAEVVDPATDGERDDYVNTYVELRKHKHMTPEKAREIMTKNIYYASMCVRKGRCDGMVGGSMSSTAKLIRAMLQIIRPAEGIKTVSSCFLMITPMTELGVDGAFIFSDAALVPDPTPEMLVDIAVASARTAVSLLEAEPKVAFLSYSTKGSGKGHLVDKMCEATELFRKAHPDVKCDGELQADSAIIPSIAERKCSESDVAGQCNVLIFPDLNVGNICYKLVQRLAGARAIGPVLQGLAKPGNDLSRGCSVEDIANTAAVTAIQAAGL